MSVFYPSVSVFFLWTRKDVLQCQCASVLRFMSFASPFHLQGLFLPGMSAALIDLIETTVMEIFNDNDGVDFEWLEQWLEQFQEV